MPDLIDRELFFGAKSPKLRRVKGEFFGMECWYWELSATKRAQYEQERVKYDRKAGVSLDLVNTCAKLLVMSVRKGGEDTAQHAFIDGDELRIGQLGASEVFRAFGVAAKISGIATGDEDESEAKKNSVTPAGGTGCEPASPAEK